MALPPPGLVAVALRAPSGFLRAGGTLARNRHSTEWTAPATGSSSVVSSRQHRVARKGLEAYLDGEADAAAAVSLRCHLDGCWACSEDAEWLMLIKVALVRLGERRPPHLATARLARYASTLADRR